MMVSHSNRFQEMSDTTMTMEEITPPAPTEGRMERCLCVALLVVLVVYTLMFLYHAGRLALYPYQIDYGEGFILNHANELASFRSPYQSIETPPWIVVHYPPVYPALVAVGIKLFGLQFNFGRFLSIAGILITGFCLFRMIRYQTSDRLAAWVGALLCVTVYPVYNWGAHHRVDSVGIALEALGLLFLLGRNHLRTAILFFVLALFCRQTLWVGPIAGYLYLRRIDGPRQAAKWFGGLLLAGGCAFALLILLTGGEFYRHIVMYNANKFHWKDVWVMLHNAVMQMMKIQTAFLLYYLMRAATTRQWDLAAFCIPLSIATFCLVGKVGAATNYMFELALAACWATALSFAELRLVLPKGNPLRLLIPTILLLGTLFPVHIPHFYGEWKIFDWGATPERDMEIPTRELCEKLKDIPEPVFSQDAGLSLLSGHQLVWDPFIMTQLADQGRVDETAFQEMIRKKTFSAIVLPFDMDLDPNAWKEGGWWTQFSQGTARVIHENYRVMPSVLVNPNDPDTRNRGYYSLFGVNYLYLRRTP